MFQDNFQALVDFALILGFRDFYATDLSSMRDMRSTVSLEIKTDDFNNTHFLNIRRQQINFGTNKVGYLEGFLSRQAVDADWIIRLHCLVNLALNIGDALP